VSSSTAEIYIPGADRESFAGPDDDRIDVLPEKPSYEPGDKARFQVRMPFSRSGPLSSPLSAEGFFRRVGSVAILRAET